MLMILRKILLTACLSIVVALSAFAQEDSVALQTIISKTAKFATNFPVEKVYLHFDKPYYAVGDTIWFKAYVTVGDHQLSALSKIVYVDMITNHDSIVQEVRLPVVNGVASGSLVLPQVSFQEGNYHVRSYTSWMRNFDPAYFFYKNITVGNTVDEKNPVNTHITFKNSVAPGTEKIDARITYKDQDGVAYINKKVSWKVQSDDETIDKGKGTTDQNGVLDLSFSSNKPGTFSTADLITDIDLNYKKSISNTFSLKTAAIPKDVQFFPEGGNLVGGVLVKIGFKAISSNGLGVEIKGTITDNDNKTVANFASQHLGMGVFTLLPDASKSYKANVTFPDGTQASFDLPRVMEEGIDLSVNNLNADTLKLKISSNEAFVQKFTNTRFYIVAQSGGIIYYAAQTNLANLVYSANIPKSKFPTGILQVSLLSSEGDPLSERIVFIQHNDLLNVTVNTDRQTYAQRQRVRMSMTAKNKDIPVSGTFSVAVIDETKVPYDENAETTIQSSMLLTSDLKGYIEKPNYYFNHIDETKIANLDILMLTQGYRRFTYSDIVYDKNPSLYFLPEQGINISGILRANNGIAVPHANVHLTIPDKIFYKDVVTDGSGNFLFQNLNFQDSSQVILNAKNNVNGKFMELNVNNDSYPALIKNVNSPDNVANIDSMLTTYLLNTKKQYAGNRVLKEVVIKAKSEEKKPSHMDYPSLTGLSPQPDHLIAASQLVGCVDMLQCLKTSAFGVSYEENDFYITRDYMQGNKSTPVQVYFNGMPVETSYLANIDPKTVESVEVFLNNGITNIGAMNNTKGVLVVNSKKIPKGEKISLADLKNLIPQKNIATLSPLGYAKVREFYLPKYAVTRSTYEIPDLRTTVYWNPNVITDKATGKASFDFPNADGKGSYKAVIEGLDIDGNIAHYVYRYKVD
jgi:hypothetical protein